MSPSLSAFVVHKGRVPIHTLIKQEKVARTTAAASPTKAIKRPPPNSLPFVFMTDKEDFRHGIATSTHLCQLHQNAQVAREYAKSVFWGKSNGG
ncbi:hypothetical protein Pelo_15113 [Pelomyxa schiedti]|nr:hypothetical protein Pelo_15113 [Pelomyxa schiedti]